MKLTSRVTSKLLGNKLSQAFIFLSGLIVLSSHDLFIKMDTYFLKPNQEAALSLYNGTFHESEGTVTP